ncbi:OB-fold putative lipoprotein [Acinetobacter baumannii]|nr:OB-fold putative lipoprotein [Acinetobacter baumannii]
MKKILMWIGIIFIVLVVIGMFAGNKNNSQNSASSTESNTPAEPPIEVTASQLLNAYKNNEVAANQQFKDKTLLVSATVNSIEAGLTDEPYLTLKAGGEYEFNMPQAHLAKEEQNKAANLSKGQKVKLLCTGNSEIAGTPMLADCTIQ